MIIRWSSPFIFAKAVIRHAWWTACGVEVIVPTSIQADRMEICQRPCRYYSDGQCLQCTCFVAAKAYSRIEDCPEGYWPKLPSLWKELWLRIQRCFDRLRK